MTDLMRELGEAIQDRHYDWMGPTGRDWGLAIAEAALAVPAIADALRDAAHLRGMAAMFGGVLGEHQTYTGAQVAAMLRDGKE